MWLKEKNFKIRLGGQIFVNVPILIQFNGESLFTVRRHEDTGEIGIDCDVYDQNGAKIASIRRNNPYPGDTVQYAVDRSEDHIILKDSATGVILAHIKKHGDALPMELDVSVRTYLPDGRFLDAGPDSTTFPGVFMAGNEMEDCPVGVAINNPSCAVGKTFENEKIRLDGKSFVSCKFVSCMFVFGATAPVRLTGNSFDNPTFAFDGPAQSTLDFMAALYRMGAGAMIESTFDAIRGKLPFPIEAGKPPE